ncbi:MAG: transposase [Microgenomates group bacterium]
MFRDLSSRHTIRLQTFDYSSPNWYYVTICTNERESNFGEIHDGKMFFSPAGRMIELEWVKLRIRYINIRLGKFVVRPNHFHGIIQSIRAGIKPAPTLGTIIGSYKSITTHEYIAGINKYDWQAFNHRLWQRNYYEHIIRNDEDFDHIQKYITNNPLNWVKDKFNM